MKFGSKILLTLAFGMMLAGFLGMFSDLRTVSAQSFGAINFGPIAPTLAQCQPGLPNQTLLCAVGSNPYVIWASYNQLPYAMLGTAGPPGASGTPGQPGIVAGQTITGNGSLTCFPVKSKTVATGFTCTFAGGTIQVSSIH